jgi:hypothetical protein
VATVNYNINLEEMLLKIPAGPEREKAAVALDEFLGIQHIPTEGYEHTAVASGVSFGGSGRFNEKRNIIESKISPLKVGTAGVMGNLNAGAFQIGVSSWVGKKLYHGFRGGYFDAKTYDPNFDHEDSGGENTYGFWATPSFAFAQTFGKKGGVVEVFLDVKRALTFNLEALTWVSPDWIQHLLKVAKIDITPFKDSRVLYERYAYNRLMGLDLQGNPNPAKSQVYTVLDTMWSLLKGVGYDGVCLPEKGLPTVAALDFSQVTYGKRVKTGDNSTSWDEYDVEPIGGQSPKPPSAGPVVLQAPKTTVPAKRAQPVTLPPKPTPPPKPVSVPKPKATQPSRLVQPSKPKSLGEGPDPRFKKGELFASWGRKGISVTPLFSGQRHGTISSRFIRSSPDTDTYGGGVRDNRLVNRVNVFVETLIVQVRKFSPGATIGVDFAPVGDSFSYRASLNVSLDRIVFKSCFSVQGVLGSTKYSVEVFAESFGSIALNGLDFRLALRVAALIKSQWIERRSIENGRNNDKLQP